MASSGHTETIETGAARTTPLFEERLPVGRRIVEAGRVRPSIETEDAVVRGALRSGRVGAGRVPAGRVPAGREVAAAPATREEHGAVLVVPVAEEVLVTGRRPVLGEELRVRRISIAPVGERSVPFRRQTATAERLPARPGADAEPNGRRDGAGEPT